MSRSLSTSRGHILERILTTKDGMRVRVAFFVSDIGGYRRVTVLSVQQAHEPALTAPRRELPARCTTGHITSCGTSSTLSIPRRQDQYIPTYSELYFFVSQPTRAPSHRN